MLRKLLYRPEALIALVSLWLMLTCDAAYWAVVAGVSSGSSSPTAAHSLLYYLAVLMVTFGLTATLLLLLAIKPVTKYLLAILLVIASAVGYFYFSQTESCGTATAESLPCMFSLQGRADFDRERSQYQDNLLDIAVRAGYKVLWLDNGNTCKKACARVESRDLHLAQIADLCRDTECFDEVLIRELESVLADVTEDTLIVLHQMGSHGPAYSLRHPDNFRVFGPECTASDLGECSQAEITNAYDNTILYTDHVIDQAIGALAARDDELDTALIYVSDHGESLGEHGLYLHGMPYRLAPSEQTHVPMLTWFSPGFAQREGLTGNCARQLAGTPVSHDYLFHTTLALLDIRTAVYQPDLDLFAACRPHNPIGTADAATTASL